MLIIGHRGAGSLEPENTIRSFKKAIELGVDMVEMDLRQSKDGQIVVTHDADLSRIFGINKKISDMSVSQIKEVSRNLGREIPTLEEVLNEISTPINFDIKVHGLEHRLIDGLKKFPNKVLISSPFPKVLREIRALDPNVDLGLIIGRGELHLLPILNRILKSLNLYSFHPKSIMVTLVSIIFLKRFRKKIFVWTVNDKTTFSLMQKLNVDGVITDSPQIFIK